LPLLICLDLNQVSLEHIVFELRIEFRQIQLLVEMLILLQLFCFLVLATLFVEQFQNRQI
jgi:hypothetical protein